MYPAYMPVQSVDETANYTEMQGPSSSVNELAARESWSNSPTKSLIGLWLLALGLYWLAGFLFRGARS